MRITGHLDNVIKTKRLFGSRWYPSATIKAFDSKLKRQLPLHGAKVRIRALFALANKIYEY